jgi:hypothetical protein
MGEAAPPIKGSSIEVSLAIPVISVLMVDSFSSSEASMTRMVVRPELSHWTSR